MSKVRRLASVMSARPAHLSGHVSLSPNGVKTPMPIDRSSVMPPEMYAWKGVMTENGSVVLVPPGDV